jgi:superfamily II DNA or RNA helicase
VQNQFTVEGQTLKVTFNSYGIDGYNLFLKAKTLPEKQLAYDEADDLYTLTTHRRFAALLGENIPTLENEMLPLSRHLFDYQREIVRRAIESRRYAVFADCGLGKTHVMGEVARQILHIVGDGAKVLILSPPKIIPQTLEKFASHFSSVPIVHLSSREALIDWLQDPATSGVAITNYEKLIPGLIPEFRNLSGLIADESSLLKTGGGVIKWNLIKSSRGIPFKLSLTATPAPNDVMEYASQASFLEKLRSEGEILWTFFKREGKGGKGDWVVKPHARKAFYEFMSSWSFYIRSPGRFGFKDNIQPVPVPTFEPIEIDSTPEQWEFAQGIFTQAGAGLYGDQSLGVTHRNKLSQAAKGFLYQGDGSKKTARPMASFKPARVAEIAASQANQGQGLIWTIYDEEARLVSEELTARGVAHAILDGRTKEADQLRIMEDFLAGRLPMLISKAGMLGYGLNFQFCEWMIFSGLNDSYEQFYQAVRRAYRYGQLKTVRVFMPVVRDLEGNTLENVLRKMGNFEADAQAQEDCFLEVYRGQSIN